MLIIRKMTAGRLQCGLKQIDHPDKDKFISMIVEAEEIECNRNDNIRMIAENDLGKKS